MQSIIHTCDFCGEASDVKINMISISVSIRKNKTEDVYQTKDICDKCLIKMGLHNIENYPREIELTLGQKFKEILFGFIGIK